MDNQLVLEAKEMLPPAATTASALATPSRISIQYQVPVKSGGSDLRSCFVCTNHQRFLRIKENKL